MQKRIRSENRFPVVGIGASAGGLDAFKCFIKNISPGSGMAYIMVQHLDPSHDSLLSEILQRITAIPVIEITDNIEVEPDHIYIIPSNKLLTATDGILQLKSRPRYQPNMPIDCFFSSLADVHQDHAIGVVLSGTGADGTRGLRAIRELGGITLAQEPGSASYDGMPRNAIEAGAVDIVLTVDKMPMHLLKLTTALKEAGVSEDSLVTSIHEDMYRKVLPLLRTKKGLDFSYYNPVTVSRRIVRRMALCMKSSFADYFAYLCESEAEQDTLFQELFIPATQFFRDDEIFESLQRKVFPALIPPGQLNESFRIWVAGCSTGEEAYSLVMCLHEYLGDRLSPSSIQVFATDISETAIAKARVAFYNSSELAGVSAARLQRFFTKSGDKFRINKTVRESIVFAYHNFLKDPPFAKIDLISCRNSLIFVQAPLQKKALTTFHYALKENGILILGKSESIEEAEGLYKPLRETNNIYARKTLKGNFSQEIALRKGAIFKENNYHPKVTEPVVEDFNKNADEIILSTYAPPAVITDHELEIVQFRGDTGMWLKPLEGKPSMNLLKMAREPIAFELQRAFEKLRTGAQMVTSGQIPFQFMGLERKVTIHVTPLLNTAGPHFLVIFKDDVSVPTVKQRLKPENQQAPDKLRAGDKAKIRGLEQEITRIKAEFKGTNEDQETFNEELQSANEELLSGSEELQSMNEELENWKQQMQVVNDELTALNQQLSIRNEQLTTSQQFAEAILSAINQPLLVLAKSLEVTRANRSFYQLFQTSEIETVGKHLYELVNKEWDLPELRKRLEKVLNSEDNLVDFEVSHFFPGDGQRKLALSAQVFPGVEPGLPFILLSIDDRRHKAGFKQ